MGHTTAKVKIYGPLGSRDVELLVDTGFTYSWMHKSTLKEIGIQSKEKKFFKTIEGKLIERGIAEAVIEYNGQKVTTIVVFAENSDSQVFGVYALEGFGLEIDPLTKTMKKAEALLAI